MNFEWDSDESFVRFDDPNLPSSFYGSDFFREQVSYDIMGADIAPWYLEELGYTNDAPYVHPDGRMDCQQYPPDYYTYSPPHTDTWEDGLQEIESFDWSSDKENEEHASGREGNVQRGEEFQAANGVNTLCLVDRDGDVNLVEGDAADLHEKVDSPTTQLENPVQNSREPITSGGNLAIPEVPSNLGPEREKAASYTNTPPHTTKHVGSDSPVINDQHVGAQDAMEIDNLSIVTDTERSNIGPQRKDNVVAEDEDDTIPNPPIFQESTVANDIVADSESPSGLEDNNAVKVPAATFALAPPNHDGLLIHKSDLESSLQIATTPQSPPRDTAIASEPLVAPQMVQEEPNLTNGCDELEPGYIHPEAPKELQTQQKGFVAQDKLHDSSGLYLQTDESRLSSSELGEMPDLTSYQEVKSFDEVPEVRFRSTVSRQSSPSILAEGDPVRSKSPDALSLMEENIDEPWQAQLQDAAGDPFSGRLSEPLCAGDADSQAQSTKLSAYITTGEDSVQANPLLTVPVSEKELDDSVTLPPLPFLHEDDVVSYETSESSPAEASADEENACAAQLTPSPSKPPVSSELDSTNTTAGNHTNASSDLENDATMAAVPEGDLVGGVSSGHTQNIPEDLGSSTSVSGSKAQPAHAHKRPKASGNTNSASETESDGPLKKKRKTSFPALAMSRARRAANDKMSKVSKPQQQSEAAPLLAKTRGIVFDSTQGAAHLDAANEASSPVTQHGNASKPGHFAYGNYTAPSVQAHITDQSDNEIIGTQPEHQGDDVDMEEHYSDVEIPITPSKHTPAPGNVPDTPNSRLSASKRGLQNLMLTKYRDHPSKAKRGTPPVSYKLLSSSKPDAFDELMSRIPGFEDSSAAPVGEDDSFNPVEGPGIHHSTSSVAERPTAKSRANSANAIKAKDSPAAPRATKNIPAARATEKRKITPERQEKSKPKDYEEHVLFPTPKIDTKKPSPEVDLPSPPPRVRVMRGKKNIDKNEEVTPFAKNIPVIEDVELHDDEDPLSDTSMPEAGNDDPEDDDDDDFEDAQETIEEPEENEDTDGDTSDTPPPTKKPKLKNKAVNLGNQTRLHTRTPARSIVSSKASPSNNKYGFKSPRVDQTRQAKKAASNSTAPVPPPAKPAPKPKAPAKSQARKVRGATAPAPEEEKGDEEGEDEPSILVPKTIIKGKGKKSTASVATATPKPTKQSSVRKTRHAHAAEDEIRLAKEEEERAREEKEKLRFKKKLRSAG